MKPFIDQTTFGSITVAGTVFEHDVLIRLNGEVKQKSRTSQLIFNIPTLISDISQFVTLEPGEVATGKIETPYNPKMKANNWNFSHANGAVKPHQVPKLGDEKEAAAKPAAKPAKAAKKK